MKRRATPQKNQPGKTKKRLIIAISAGAAILLLAGLAYARSHQSSDDSEANTTNNSANSNTDTSPVPQTTDAADNSGEPTGVPDKSRDAGGGQPTPDGQAKITDPYGTFVSNHKPHLNSTPATNQIQSVCITTPGATCNITFTKDGVTKSLGDTKTNNEGSAYWNWTLQEKGLTSGKWQITVTASLNGQSKTTQDQLPLDVQP